MAPGGLTRNEEVGTCTPASYAGQKGFATSAAPLGHSREAKPCADQHSKEEAIANVTGLLVLSAIGAAVPVRLMKRDLLFVAERLANLLSENRGAILAKRYGIKKAKENEPIGKLLAAFLRRADEGTMGRAVVGSVVLLTASRGNASQALRDAATAYKVDTEAITAKVK